MDTNNMDMGKMMDMLSKMDKKQLEQGLEKLNNLLSSEEKEKLIREFKKNC